MANPNDSGLKRFKEIKANLDALSGGEARFDVGRGEYTYPIRYNAQAMPPSMYDAELIEGITGHPATFNATLTDEDRRMMRAKTDMMEEADLHRRFFEHYHPFDDPVRYTILRKIWPEPFEAMKKTLEDKADKQKEIQVKMLDDLDKDSILLQMAVSDRKEFQNEVLSTAVGPVRGEFGMDTAKFKRGLFNPYDIMRAKATSSMATAFRTSPNPTIPASGIITGMPGEFGLFGGYIADNPRSTIPVDAREAARDGRDNFTRYVAPRAAAVPFQPHW